MAQGWFCAFHVSGSAGQACGRREVLEAYSQVATPPWPAQAPEWLLALDQVLSLHWAVAPAGRTVGRPPASLAPDLALVTFAAVAGLAAAMAGLAVVIAAAGLAAAIAGLAAA